MLLPQNGTVTAIPHPVSPPSIAISDSSGLINKGNLVSFHQPQEQVFRRLTYISNLVLVRLFYYAYDRRLCTSRPLPSRNRRSARQGAHHGRSPCRGRGHPWSLPPE